MKMGKYIKTANAATIMKWVKVDPETDAWILQEDCPYLVRPPGRALSIKAETLPGHDYNQKTTLYSPQNWVYTALGDNPYQVKRKMYSITGNPMDINPQNLRYNQKKQDSVSANKLNQYREVMRMSCSANGYTQTQIAEYTGVCRATVKKYQEQMLQDMFGSWEDRKITFNDVQHVILLLEGMCYAEHRRAKTASELLRDMLSKAQPQTGNSASLFELD